ncbi:hypothetical protein PoB_002197900 [Plakobranchus ocellatus]|uniref:Uncharacterized protein n=1 Tax=Plakobranchus ocellatus TaxID=259542 RepID=A0AAV3ZJH7_9GAST|nr:hypothetical protein PoB_002197900 [Plakobranchus ocellatus]
MNCCLQFVPVPITVIKAEDGACQGKDVEKNRSSGKTLNLANGTSHYWKKQKSIRNISAARIFWNLPEADQTRVKQTRPGWSELNVSRGSPGRQAAFGKVNEDEVARIRASSGDKLADLKRTLRTKKKSCGSKEGEKAHEVEKSGDGGE